MIARKGHVQKMQNKHFSAEGRAGRGGEMKKNLEIPVSDSGMM
jgi:hypothetical protein